MREAEEWEEAMRGMSKDRQRFADTDSGLADAAKIKLPFYSRNLYEREEKTSLNTVFSQVSHLTDVKKALTNVIFLMDAFCCLLRLKIAHKKH